MLLKNDTPLAVDRFHWRREGGPRSFTVICKATYRIEPGESRLVPPAEQEPIRELDVFEGNDKRRAPRLGGDYVPSKEDVDVVVVGSAFSKLPTTTMYAILAIGAPDQPDLRRTLVIVGDRRWRSDGGLTEAIPFKEMPLLWERAAGGPGTDNPVGVTSVSGGIAPNLFFEGRENPRLGEKVEPAGLGPISPFWPARASFTRAYGQHWNPSGWLGSSIPADLPASYFKLAPAKQRLRQFRFELPILLQGLHRTLPTVRTTLAGVFPQVLVDMGERSTNRAIPLRCDTLWFDTHTGTCTVSWRGETEDMGEGATIHVVHTRPLPFVQVGAKLLPTPLVISQPDPSETTYTPPREEAPRPAGPQRPLPAQAPAHEAVVARQPTDLEGTSAFPAGYAEAAMQRLVATGPIPVVAPSRAPVRPGDTAPAPPSAAAVSPVHPGPPPSLGRDLGPAIIMNPSAPLGGPIAPPASVKAFSDAAAPPQSLWADGAVPQGAAPSAVAAAPVEVPANDFRARAHDAGFVVPNAEDAATLQPARPATYAGSAVGLSNAAAGGSPALRLVPMSRPKLDPVLGLALDPIWVSAAAHARCRQHTPWRELQGQIQPPLDDLPADTPKEKRTEIRQRREVLAIMGRVETVDATQLDAAMSSAVSPDGTFFSPLVVASGFLELPFDELETLRATLAAVAPFAPQDEEVKHVVEAVEKLLQTPWVAGGGEGSQTHTKRLRDVFQKRIRSDVPVETTTTRILLQKRAYQKRNLLGGPHIRALLHTSQGVDRTTPAPVYLPESIANELPAFTGFLARVLAEARPAVDQEERHTVALQPFALGRVLGRGR